MMRAFIAIALPGDVKKELVRAQQVFKAAGLVQARYAHPATFHLTLNFLGEIPEEAVVPVKAALEQAASRNRPFGLSLSGFGTFGQKGRPPRVLWAGVAGQIRILGDITHQLSRNLPETCLKNAQNRYFPHITLARFKGKPSFGRVKALVDQANDTFAWQSGFYVKHIDLLKSRLTPRGAVHTPIFSARLDGPGGKRA